MGSVRMGMLPSDIRTTEGITRGILVLGATPTSGNRGIYFDIPGVVGRGWDSESCVFAGGADTVMAEDRGGLPKGSSQTANSF